MLTENPYSRQWASTLFFQFCGLDNGVNLQEGSEDRVLIEAVRKVDEDSVPRDVKKQLSEMVSKPN